MAKKKLFDAGTYGFFLSIMSLIPSDIPLDFLKFLASPRGLRKIGLYFSALRHPKQFFTIVRVLQGYAQVIPIPDLVKVDRTQEHMLSHGLLFQNVEGGSPTNYHPDDIDKDSDTVKMNNWDGNDYARCLTDNDFFRQCLSMHDGIAFKKLGADFVREFFDDNNLFLWKSVYKTVSGETYVPRLSVEDGMVSIQLVSIDQKFGKNDVAPRFKA